MTGIGTGHGFSAVKGSSGKDMDADELDNILARLPTALVGGKMSCAPVTLVNTQGIAKNTALAGFEFVMAAAGLTVTVQRSIDGAAFAATTNSPTEIGSKAYKIDLSAADLNGNTVLFKASASGQPDAFFSIVTRQA